MQYVLNEYNQRNVSISAVMLLMLISFLVNFRYWQTSKRSLSFPMFRILKLWVNLSSYWMKLSIIWRIIYADQGRRQLKAEANNPLPLVDPSDVDYFYQHPNWNFKLQKL